MMADGAPRAQLRFFNQLAEQQQFFNADPERRPYQVKGVGQDSAYSKKRILRIRVLGRGFDDAEKRRAASRLGRLGFRGLSVPGS